MRIVKFDLSQSWMEAMAMIRANREVIGIVAGIFFFLPALLFALIGPRFESLFESIEPGQVEQVMRALNTIYAQYWWLFLLLILTQMLGYLALLALLRGEARPTVGEAIGAAFKGLLPAFVAYMVFVAGTSLALTLFIALFAAVGGEALAAVAVLASGPGVLYLVVKVSLAAPVIALEQTYNPLAVLLRSWRLTHGNSLRLLALLLLLLVVYVVLSAVLGILLLALMTVFGEAAGRIVSSVFTSAIGAAATVVLVTLIAAVHRQLAGPWPSLANPTDPADR